MTANKENKKQNKGDKIMSNSDVKKQEGLTPDQIKRRDERIKEIMAKINHEKNIIKKYHTGDNNAVFECLSISYDNGLRHGDMIIYYSADRIRSITPYKHGFIHGVKKVYFKNGRIKSETQYENGKINGLVKRYRKNSDQIKTVSSYVNDIKHGIEKGFYRNGVLKYEASFHNGVLDGVAIEYSKTQQWIETTKFINGVFHGSHAHMIRY